MPTNPEPITIEQTRTTARHVRELANHRDFEAAHGLEDDLRLRVLRTIAARPPTTLSLIPLRTMQQLARVTVRLSNFDYPRYTA